MVVSGGGSDIQKRRWVQWTCWGALAGPRSSGKSMNRAAPRGEKMEQEDKIKISEVTNESSLGTSRYTWWSFCWHLRSEPANVGCACIISLEWNIIHEHT